MSILPIRDQKTYALRELYESYGYDSYRMSNFESYDVYSENKSFLNYDGIITLNANDGQLLALKPDITLSIAINADEGVCKAHSRKNYYCENVFRMVSGAGEFSEIFQIGVEYIGGDINYSVSEVTLLAAKTMSIISEDYILAINHMGMINSLIDSVIDNDEDREECLAYIKSRNRHGMKSFLADKGYTCEALVELTGMYTKLCNVSIKYRGLLPNGICDELDEIAQSLSSRGAGENIFFDTSVISDPKYYNGMVYAGFVPGMPKAVLTGGRYDKLMKRFGKDLYAVGFALNMSELDTYLKDEDRELDILIIYGDKSPSEVFDAIEKYRVNYSRIRAEKTDTGTKAKEKIIL